MVFTIKLSHLFVLAVLFLVAAPGFTFFLLTLLPLLLLGILMEILILLHYILPSLLGVVLVLCATRFLRTESSGS